MVCKLDEDEGKERQGAIPVESTEFWRVEETKITRGRCEVTVEEAERRGQRRSRR